MTVAVSVVDPPDCRVGDREVRSNARLTAAIQWRKVNLVDKDATAGLGHFDVVLYRNVLIYFDDPTTRRVVSKLGDALHPGGALLVGVSESLLRFGLDLQCEERAGTFCYRRAE